MLFPLVLVPKLGLVRSSLVMGAANASVALWGTWLLGDRLGAARRGLQIRALAVLGPTRAPAVPEVPSIVEAGLPDVQGVTFNGLFAPKATPPAVIDKLSAVIRVALAKKEVIDKLGELGSEARGSTPEEFGVFLRAEIIRYAKVIKDAGIRAE